MSKHPIDHDRARDDAKVAEKYSKIEREKAEDVTDPKVKAMTKAAHKGEPAAGSTRVEKFLKIDREAGDS